MTNKVWQIESVLVFYRTMKSDVNILMSFQNEKKRTQYFKTNNIFFQERKIVNFAEKIIYPKLNRTNVLLNSCCCRSVPNVSYMHATTTALGSRMGGGYYKKPNFRFLVQKYGIGSLFMVRLTSSK